MTTMRDTDSPTFDDNEIEYDPPTERYHLTIDPERTLRPSLVVVQFLASITDSAPLALPPLYSAIDTDSLDNWLSTTPDHRSDFELTFTYAGYRITLDNAGNLWAQPTDVDEENSNETPTD